MPSASFILLKSLTLSKKLAKLNPICFVIMLAYTVWTVLVDFAVCDWRRYSKVLYCDVKFSQIQGNVR